MKICLYIDLLGSFLFDKIYNCNRSLLNSSCKSSFISTHYSFNCITIFSLTPYFTNLWRHIIMNYSFNQRTHYSNCHNISNCLDLVCRTKNRKIEVKSIMDFYIFLFSSLSSQLTYFLMFLLRRSCMIL